MVGRSFHDGKQPALDEYSLTPDTNKGLFFAEQWKRALQVDPPMIWLTQWNEWTAVPGTTGNGNGLSVGKSKMRPGSFHYIDVYNREFTRDMAPDLSGSGDNYYLQMVDGIRKFKGARQTPVETAFHTIDIRGRLGAVGRDCQRIPRPHRRHRPTAIFRGRAPTITSTVRAATISCAPK